MVANLKRRMREIIFIFKIHRNRQDSLNYAGSIAEDDQREINWRIKKR